MLSFFSGALQRPNTLFFARHARWANLASGILILSLGVAELILSLDLISSGWGL